MNDGSKPLANNRHEAFARHCTEGKTDSEAYRKAGYKGDEPRKRAAEIRANQDVAARIVWLKRAAQKKTFLTVEEKRDFLALAVRTPLSEIDETHPLCQSAEYQVNGGIRGQLRRGNYESGNEDEIPETTTVKIKAVDKLNAIKIDNEMDHEVKAKPVTLSGGIEVTIQQIFTLVSGGRPDA